MSYTPTSGNVAVARVSTSSGLIIPGISWKFNIDPKLKDASNFRDGRVKVGTLVDGNVTIRLVWDSAAPPTLTAGENIRPGSTGVLYLFTDATNYYIVPGIWGPAGPENPGVEDVVMYDGTFEYSAGSITYPANG